ncbi:hypothetical protein VTJ83DRAFT_1493 [Remersonia thermophila]|uniref:ribonuclease H n=1 Tax=Remersonia thermophila TaxID=72144 RepID=A0ABR4DIF1_9PEZI
MAWSYNGYYGNGYTDYYHGYSLEESCSESADSDGWEDEEPTRGTGETFPTVFTPPSNRPPQQVFTGRWRVGSILRHTLPWDKGICIIYTDGSCVGNGQENPRAGWAFWHGSANTRSRRRLVVSGRLEEHGPFGDKSAQTSNRAELRAVIAALRFRNGPAEGFHTTVIATDSDYVVKGATKWVKKWLRNDWTTRGNYWVKNIDLWEALLGEVERWEDRGMEVQFWKIPREWNTVADEAAREAAIEGEAPMWWEDPIGHDLEGLVD